MSAPVRSSFVPYFLCLLLMFAAGAVAGSAIQQMRDEPRIQRCQP